MHCSYHLLLYLHFPLILALSEQHPFIITKDKPRHIISFGDSYTDTSFDPTTPPLPCVSCPLGSPSCLVGDCYTGGHNWLTALTTLSNRTLTVTHNFARSGDVVDSALVTRKSIKSRQMPQMKEVWERRSEDVLWSFFIGINDIGATFDNGKHPDDPAFLDKVYSSYFEIIEELYWDYSARTFLLLNVPDTTRTPYYLAVLNEEERKCVHTAVVGANERLGEKAREFIGSHEGVKMYHWNSFTEYNKLLDNPGRYGFVDATTVCGSDECIWKNAYHPSEAAQKIFGESVAAMLEMHGWW